MKKFEFLGKAIEHLVSEGKSIKLINRKSVLCDGVPTGGFYTDNGMSLATKHNEWFEVFIHEYCHFLQELDKTYEPVKPNSDDESAWCSYDSWLKGDIELEPKILAKYTTIIRNCEIDCEKRTIELIKRNKLEIDTFRYTQEANVYALFYTLATKYRMWYVETGPLSIPELVDMMPTEIKKSWHRVPKEFERIVREKCFKLS